MKTLAQAATEALSSPQTCPASPTSNWRPTLDLGQPADESLKRAADACAKFVADIEAGAEPYWLTLTGAPGNGKTMLTTQTYLEARKHRDRCTANHPQQFGTYSEKNRRPYYRWIDETGFSRMLFEDRQYDLPEYLAHEWLLCYDDVGTKTFMAHGAREGYCDAIFRLANQRLGKWTLWSTNFTLSEITQRVDGRLSSRLIRDRNRLVTITAPDYALRQDTKKAPGR